MAWQTLATIQTTPEWVLTEPVAGNLFRINHIISGGNIQSLRSVVAQAFKEENKVSYFKFERLTYKPEIEIVEFIQPEGLLNRRLAIKRLDTLPNNWRIEIEVLDGEILWTKQLFTRFNNPKFSVMLGAI